MEVHDWLDGEGRWQSNSPGFQRLVLTCMEEGLEFPTCHSSLSHTWRGDHSVSGGQVLPPTWGSAVHQEEHGPQAQTARDTDTMFSENTPS